MDAVKFLTELTRFCKMQNGICNDCHIQPMCMVQMTKEQAINIVEYVEQWSKEHPIRTRKSEFLKLFPNAKRNGDDGVPQFCPENVDTTFHCDYPHTYSECYACRKKYWSEEID